MVRAKHRSAGKAPAPSAAAGAQCDWRQPHPDQDGGDPMMLAQLRQAQRLASRDLTIRVYSNHGGIGKYGRSCMTM